MSKRRRSMVLRTYMMGVGHLHTCDAPVRPSGTAHEQQGHSGSLAHCAVAYGRSKTSARERDDKTFFWGDALCV